MPANLTLLTWKRAFPFSLLLLAGCQVASIAPEPERSAPPLSDESINSQTLQDNSAEQAISKLDPLAAITYDNVWERLTDGFELQQYYSHPGVESAVDLYAGKQAYFDRISARAQPYLYWIVEEIEKRNLPLEIAVIPIIESGFNPHAYSANTPLVYGSSFALPVEVLDSNKIGGMTGVVTP
ncbi:MAG: hypothetical protein COC19_00575 [SAR86 cluster bacterium]|uniref:Transglycosylase SLT domain-containing protein n=1 Tax=SAR86 cluster bacterium TaxID=2030880 RepID=A0A2A4MUQ3_9GAMM|nr:MAG: hypothetical protein COC19_00575 [SAR86 cluster bacterium]